MMIHLSMSLTRKGVFITKTTIFYFSSTGNSLALARDIAKGLGDTELISIPNVINGDIEVSGTRIGLIFPVYGWGLPRIVVEFLRKLKISRQHYIFAVATCAGTPGKTLLQLKNILEKAGGQLNAGFVVKEGANTLMDDPGLVRFMKRIAGKKYASGKERLPEILKTIKEKKIYKPDTSSFAANLIGGLLYGLVSRNENGFKSMDSQFTVDNHCIGCRTCERLCPRANIKVTDGKPTWHHNCELCYACIQWCPQNAIHIKNETCRYRNPGIKAEDLMLR